MQARLGQMSLCQYLWQSHLAHRLWSSGHLCLLPEWPQDLDYFLQQDASQLVIKDESSLLSLVLAQLALAQPVQALARQGQLLAFQLVLARQMQQVLPLLPSLPKWRRLQQLSLPPRQYQSACH